MRRNPGVTCFHHKDEGAKNSEGCCAKAQKIRSSRVCGLMLTSGLYLDFSGETRMVGDFGSRALGAALLILAVLSGEARAQKRVFGKVQTDANQVEELYFDVNQITTDNIAPNIVLAADGKRGFVGYSGSGTVLVF